MFETPRGTVLRKIGTRKSPLPPVTRRPAAGQVNPLKLRRRHAEFKTAERPEHLLRSLALTFAKGPVGSPGQGKADSCDASVA